MPKRIIDGEAVWSSDKLAACEIWARREYPWLYPLADANGCFELTNLRVIWGKVAAIRPDLTTQRLQEVFQQFTRHGLLFTWSKNGKRYGHWTRSEGRLPPRSERSRHKSLAPDVPVGELAKYLNSFGIKEVSNTHDPGPDLVLDLVSDLGKLNSNTEKETLVDWIPLSLWRDYVAMRERLKHPLTAAGMDIQIAKLRELRDSGEDIVAVLEQAIGGSWFDFKPVRKERNSGPGESFAEKRSRTSAAAIQKIFGGDEKLARPIRRTLPPTC